MTYLKKLTIVLFCVVILVPVLTLDVRSDVVSEIDNRKLAPNPFSGEATGDLTDNIENYINDRIGFRDEMILGYTVLNDRLFGKMVHPSYTYGKNGYVFGAGLDSVSYSAYHESFADMVKTIQDYCTARDVPFLFVFQPAKPAVLSDQLPDGLYYDRSWVDQFMAALDARGVHYLDNTVTLQEKTMAGERVFNQKYDANHWNDLGAYYGVSRALELLQESLPAIHVTQPQELTISQSLMTSLPVSKFPISEYIPSISVAGDYDTRHEQFAAELEMHPSFPTFRYYVNPARQEDGAPRALVFQGSYMNGFGYKYMINAFGEYICVHDYQNILNFEYYFNIFQPECVIFEVAEYTLTETYFRQSGMEQMRLNPVLDDVRDPEITSAEVILSPEDLSVTQGTMLTTITWHTPQSWAYVWLDYQNCFDFRKCDGGYEIVIQTELYQQIKDSLRITALSEDETSLTTMVVE